MTVDPLGYLWMAGYTGTSTTGFHSKLYRYSPEGELVQIIDTEAAPGLSVRQLAFDRFTGDMWVQGFLKDSGSLILRLTAASGYTEYDRRFPHGFNETSLTYDSVNELLYMITVAGVDVYNTDGVIVVEIRGGTEIRRVDGRRCG